MTVILVGALILVIGANPWEAAKALVEGSLIEPFFLGQTLMIASILALTGLAAALPFTSRLWNIGGEGQMFAGAMAAVALGIELPSGIPKALFVLIIVLGSFVGGAVWGLIPGALKAFYGASEIVTTLMLSFVAVFVANYIIADVWPDPFSQKTVSINDKAQFPAIWKDANVDISVLIAVAAAALAWILMTKTSLGFSIRVIGANANAARLAGVATKQVTMLTFLVAGGFAGLAGGVAVAGIFDDLDINFSSNFGFIGIAVALLARLKPPLVIPAAFLFSMLRVGSNSLQASADISPSLGDIVVAVFVILLMVTGAIRFRYAQNVSD
ncbi:ABC transporter permease [Candidatus Poriferisocius sp.]|uniref:ABC transporter permease n=1 Tax=Candidatus Poriferisocius sp. TaxID=3101276 RepID=UPI003B59D08E